MSIEVGGTRKGSAPTDVPSSRTVDCSGLPNPFPSIRAGKIASSPLAVAQWLQDKKLQSPQTRRLLADLVAEAAGVLERGERVRVQCLFGKHRSRAVAMLASEAVGGAEVVYVD